MRIAVSHPYCWPEVRRGAERITVETARALAGRGHAVTILTSGRRSGRWVASGVTTVCFRRIWRDPVRHEAWFGRRLWPALLRGRYEVVHSLMPADARAAIRTARWAGHRTVYEELGIPLMSWWSQQPDRATRLEVVRRVDVYGCMSQFALGVLERDHGRAGRLIPGGVRMDEFVPSPEREPNPTILFSGALNEPRKGVSTLLESLPLVAEAEPEVVLWLSGPGDARSLLEAGPTAAAARTVVLDLGQPHDQARRYARAWVTALPSVNESFGMVLLESLACGTPIVVADDSAPPELVRPGAGALCRPGDPESLAAALVRAIRLGREQSTVEVCRAVAAAYDWDGSIAPLLEAIYQP